MEEAVNLGTVLGAEKKRRITIHAPFLHMTKADEIRLGIKLGVDFSLTWSCYREKKDLAALVIVVFCEPGLSLRQE